MEERVTKVSRTELLEQRAKKLAERYGLEFRLSDWITGAEDDTVLRVDKPIRIRIRRTCHLCNATFVAAEECSGCQHVCCKDCPRYPPKRTEAEKAASRERKEAVSKDYRESSRIVADLYYDGGRVVLKRSSKTGGQDLIHRRPRQRVRRTCHECQTLFMPASKKDPPKKDKYPFGYPGDAFGPNSVPRYECQRCQTLYPEGASDGVECAKCGTKMSVASPRALPRKIEPEPDPGVLKMLQARLDSLKVS
ncbi:zinc finger domain-containing protein [Purpureocillium lilacinum]|uniref:Zinc finger domain-containing protein n=1 Tax=Purpureocillium lilacinum TaxID=33203 RepID=A0A179HYN9_PURLI|nr:zinc finger domain-containing protein [Purpureocillium lilacinum]OAQ86690.1 zinc finger domain-containing protein [Purpureocillium lilacinum]OAQ94651.1 zinc finger domain-containing protein [Purpureocillium lilacinum]GJN67058.1 hypothetical protein PLICBS_001081 [Purpureocillium lilacinum]